MRPQRNPARHHRSLLAFDARELQSSLVDLSSDLLTSPLWKRHPPKRRAGIHIIQGYRPHPSLSTSSSRLHFPLSNQTPHRQLPPTSNPKLPSAAELAAMPTYPSPSLPPSGPLLLDSYSNPHGSSSCNHLLNPTTNILSSFPNRPTILMTVKTQSLADHLFFNPFWTRLREVVLDGFLPAFDQPLPRIWATEELGERDLRVTIDLRRIEGKVEPRIVNGSCQKMVESWAKQLSGGGHRGRIRVGTEVIKADLGIAIEEVRKRCEKGTLTWEELGRLDVEVRALPPPIPL